MIYIIENILPILAATIAAYVFGAIYYSALSKPWMKASRITPAEMHGASGFAKASPFIISFVAEFWMASILAGALILAPVEAGVWTVAFGTAFILFIGFVFPTMAVNNAYSFRKPILTLIDGVHWLGVLLIMAGVLRLIGVEGPDGPAMP